MEDLHLFHTLQKKRKTLPLWNCAPLLQTRQIPDFLAGLSLIYGKRSEPDRKCWAGKDREGSEVYLLPEPPQEGEKRDAQPTGPSSALDCVYFCSFFFISLTLEEGREEKLALNNNFFN
jgi:hypothetical protein